MNKPNSETPENETPKKKPYNKPQLRVYGDIRAITRGPGGGKSLDGGAIIGLKTRG